MAKQLKIKRTRAIKVELISSSNTRKNKIIATARKDNLPKYKVMSRPGL